MKSIYFRSLEFYRVIFTQCDDESYMPDTCDGGFVTSQMFKKLSTLISYVNQE
jgi:hypothetical protein